MKSPTQWQYEALCASLQPLPRATSPPFPPSRASFPAASAHIVFELCIQAAATFQCLNCHRFLHPRQADQVRRLAPRSAHIPPTAPFLHEDSVCGMLPDARGGSPRPAAFRVEQWGGEQALHRKLVLCSKLSSVLCFCFCFLFCFGLSVQALQLLNSALPLIKPRSPTSPVYRLFFCPKRKSSQTKA